MPGPEILVYHCADEEELEGELTEGYRGLADVEDLLWDEETEKGQGWPHLNPYHATTAILACTLTRSSMTSGALLQVPSRRRIQSAPQPAATSAAKTSCAWPAQARAACRQRWRQQRQSTRRSTTGEPEAQGR